jgi:hypothetical protein
MAAASCAARLHVAASSMRSSLMLPRCLGSVSLAAPTTVGLHASPLPSYTLRWASTSGPGGQANMSGTAKAKLEKEKRAKRRRSKNLQFKVCTAKPTKIEAPAYLCDARIVY